MHITKELTKRERYLRAMRCQQPDRVPIVVRGVNPMFGTAGLPPSNHPSFNPLIEAATAKTEWAYRWHPEEENLLSTHPDAIVRSERITSDQDGFDEVFRIFETPLGPLKTIKWVSREGKPGMTKKYLIETLEDVDKFLAIPYEFKKPDYSGFYKMVKAMGDNGILMASIGNDPIGHVTHWLGLETLAMWSILHREAIIRLVDEFHRRAEFLVKSMLTEGIGPVFATLGMEQCTPPWLSPADFTEFARQYDERLWAPIREENGLVHVHCHGNLKSVLDDFIAMGASCLHPIEAPPMGDVTLKEAKKILGGKICIEGNTQIDDLYMKDPDYIREAVSQAMKDAAGGG